MKIERCYIVIIVAVLFIDSTLLSGCHSTNQAKIDELEKQIATLEKQTTEKEKQTQTFEKDISEILSTGDSTAKDRQTLIFQVKSGDIIEGDVSVTYGTGKFISTVKDPFGNILLQSKTYSRQWNSKNLLGSNYTFTMCYSSQVYPWRFSFFASVSGDYSLEVGKDESAGTGIVVSNAHLRIVVNP
jgi:outer membrane murein-binding lipoprotein Lpp